MLMPLEDSTVVDNSMNFIYEVRVFSDYGCNDDPPFNITDNSNFWNAILGLELQHNSQKYYGWIRMEMYDNAIRIIEYAYNTKPNEPIKAGQKE